MKIFGYDIKKSKNNFDNYSDTELIFKNFNLKSGFSQNIYLENIYHKIATEFASSIKVKNTYLKDHNFKRVREFEYNFNIKANIYQNSYDFWYMNVRQLMEYGFSINYYDYDTQELMIIDNQNKNFKLENDYLIFYQKGEKVAVRKSSLMICRFRPSEVFNLSTFGEENLKPFVNLINDNLDSLNAMINGNGTINAFIKMETNLSNKDMAKFEQSWLRKQFENAKGGFGFLQKGQEVVELKKTYSFIEKEQVQWLEKQLYTAFGLNEELFTANYTEQQYLAFYRSTLKPLIKIFSNEFNDFFIGKDKYEDGQRLLFIIPVRDLALLKDYSHAIDKEIWNGIKPVNELRIAEGKDPIEGGWEHQMNKNVAPITEESNEKEDKE